MSKLAAKITAVGISVVTTVSLSAPVAFGQSVADLQAQIAALLAQIQQLQAQLSTVQGGGSMTAVSCNFTRNLTLGSTGDDVKCLQQFLNAQGNTLATSGAGSPGNETTYFGSRTQSALAAWQAAHNVSPAVGYFGPITRAAIASMGGTGTTGGGIVVVPAGTDLQVSLAADSPTAKTIGSGTAFNPALKFVLAAGSRSVTVTAIRVTKTGFLANTNLNGVEVVDATGNRYGNVVTSINADNTVLLTFPATPITLGAGQSMAFLIRFNLASGNYTGTVGFSIDSVSAITANTTAIAGAFPLTGATFNIVNGGSSLASTTLDVLALSSSTLNVDGSSAQDITKFRIQETSSNEGVRLYRLSLYNYGSAGGSDYKDVQLVAQDGTVLATAQPSEKWVHFDLSASPYLIDKGLTKDFTVKAKLISGTTRTINFVVYNNYDVDVRGVSTGVSVIPGAGTNDTSFPIGNGWNIQTIGSGSIQFNRDVSSPSTAVVPGATNVVLAKYYAKPTGEQMELRQVSFGIVQVGTGLTGTVYVKVNDQIVYSAAANTTNFPLAGTAATVTLSSYPILNAGVNSYITVEASINSTATSSNNYMVNDFDLIQVKRIVTNDLVDPGVSPVDGHQISVSAGALTVTTLATPVAQSVVAGTNQFELAQIQLNSQSGGEDVRISSIVVTDTLSGGNTAYGGVANLTIWKGSEQLVTTGSTATNANTVTFNFQTAIVVPRSSPVTLTLKGDILSVTSSTIHTYNVAAAGNVTATGFTTGNSLGASNITVTGAGQAITVASAGTLTLSLVSGSGASPSTDQLVAVGTTNGTYFAFKMTSQVEQQKITSLTLTATSTGSTGLATSTLQNIRLYEGTTLIQSAPQMSCAAGQCTVTWTSSDNILTAPVPFTGVTLYVKSDLGAGGIADLGNSFKFTIKATTDVAVKGAVSATTTATVSGTPTATGVTYVVPFRVWVEGTSPTGATQVGTAAGQTIGVFKITNSGSAPVYVSTTPFTLANGGSASATVQFNVYGSAAGGTSADASLTYATSSGNGGATGASSTLPFTLSASEANRTIPGGSWRYVTVRTSAASANNDTYQLSVSALGNVVFYVTEAELGYSGNPSSDTDVSDTIYNLYIEGLPSLGTVTAKT